MKSTQVLRKKIRQTGALLVWVVCVLSQTDVFAAEEPVITAIASRVSSAYLRTRQADGTFSPEAYAFGEGGTWNGTMRDDSINRLKFMDVARTISRPLFTQNFVPARDPAKAKLLIMVYWGMTGNAAGLSSSIATQNASSANRNLAQADSARNAMTQIDPGQKGKILAGIHGSDWGTVSRNSFLDSSGDNALQARLEVENARSELNQALLVASSQNSQRDREDWQNAQILGYDSALAATTGLEFTALGQRRQDLLDEIEDNRYYVVLMAYDFQALARKKEHKLLWEIRYSIRQRGSDFDQQLSAMTEAAARYFGQDSHGLIRKRPPTESVKLDELKILGVAPDNK